MSSTLVVIAKQPRPGRVKTRLHSRFTPEEAAGLAAASLTDTLAAVLASEVDRRVVALDGGTGDWLPSGFALIDQGSGGLDLRLETVFEQLLGSGRPPDSGRRVEADRVLLVGMDTPQLTPDLLTPDWAGADAVLGLSEDGGFWAVGLSRHCPGAFRGVPMSTALTGAAQLTRLRSLGLKVHLLPVLRDVDTPDDAAAVARLAPGTRFARLHRRLVARVGSPRRVAEHPLELYAAALDGRRIQAERADGHRLPFAVERWIGAPDSTDLMMVSRCEGAVLDVGCGPGRLVGALAEAGRPALGVDISERAVQLTADRGASVLLRPVQGPLPGEGRWGTVLLADGNIGIGGDPAALLRRCHRLLRPGGLLIAETDPDDQVDDITAITLIDDAGRRSHPLPWARLGSLALARLAALAGFVVVEEWRVADRVVLGLRATSLAVSGAEESVEPIVTGSR